MDELQPLVPTLSGPAWTAAAPLPGGDFAMGAIDALKADLAREYPSLDAATLDRVARAYGTKAREWLAVDPGEDFGHGLTGAEVDYLKANEWARTAKDVLWRRTKLGLRLDAAQAARLKTYMGE